MTQKKLSEEERKAAALMGMAFSVGKEFPEMAIPLWMNLLEEFTASEVENGVVMLIKSFKYKTMPTFADLREFLPKKGPERIDPEKEKALKAEAEWQHLLDDIHHYGIYNEPTMMHPVTEYVLRGLGGWRAACMWMEDELHWRKEEFIAGWIRTDGVDLAMLEGGAAAIEQRQAQIALGNGDDRTLKRITRSVVRRLEA